MTGKDIVMATHWELRRLHVIHNVLDGGIKQIEAADILSLTDRQIRRIVKKIRIEGDGAIVHKSRGKPSNRRLPEKVKHRIIKLYQDKFSGFGPTFASEKLLEMEGIQVNDETLRKWLIESGEWKKTRKNRRHRQWRERKPHIGEMIQIDGSHHDWFEGRGPECVLMLYIDDATGNIFARFYEYEGTIPAMDSFKKYVRRYGIPASVYLDKHMTYKSPDKPSLKDYTEPLSEFQRAMKELGVRVLHANSPQAKGRVERAFRTLQDRLIKEMRLRGTKNIDEGNEFLDEYLPLHNKKFAVKPKGESDLHRRIPKGLNIDRILCIKTDRVLRNDFTISYDNKLYQIADNIKAEKVTVEKRINGAMFITHKDTFLKFKEITERPERQKKPRVPKKKTCNIPLVNHPWRTLHNKQWKKNRWLWASA